MRGGVDHGQLLTVERAGAEHHPQHAPRVVVEDRAGQPAVADGGRQFGEEVRTAELLVQARERGRHTGLRGGVVGTDRAVEAPLVLEDIVEQREVLAHELPVDLVVGAHRRPRVLRRGGERGQVDLPQRAVVHVGASGLAVLLLVVGREVLHLGGDLLALHTLDEARAEHAGEVRVLAVALEVPARLRDPHDVDHRRVQDLVAAGLGLLAHHGARLGVEAAVEARRECDRCREGGGLGAVPHARRTVGRRSGGMPRRGMPAT